jgi:hypothetical protein
MKDARGTKQVLRKEQETATTFHTVEKMGEGEYIPHCQLDNVKLP